MAKTKPSQKHLKLDKCSSHKSERIISTLSCKVIPNLFKVQESGR